MGTLTILGGTTWIGGDQIITDTIVGNRIKANAIVGTHIKSDEIIARHILAKEITSDKLEVNDLSAIKGNFASVNTGPLTVNGSLAMNATGKMYSGTKSTFGNNSVAGFFLGYDGGLSKFDVGDGGDYLRWNGSNLSLKTTVPLDITSDASNAIFRFHSPGGRAASMYFDIGGNNAFEFDAQVKATNLVAQNVLTIDNALNAGSDVLKFTVPAPQANPGSDTFRYDRTGSNPISAVTGTVPSLLTYSGDVRFQRTVQMPKLYVTGNSLTILNPSSIASHSSSPGATAGEMRWGDGCFYIWDGGSWMRARLDTTNW